MAFSEKRGGTGAGMRFYFPWTRVSQRIPQRGSCFTRFHRRKNRGSLAIFLASENAHLGASKSRAIFLGAVKITAAAAENRANLVHSGPNHSHAGSPVEFLFSSLSRTSTYRAQTLARDTERLHRFCHLAYVLKLLSDRDYACQVDRGPCAFDCLLQALYPSAHIVDVHQYTLLCWYRQHRRIDVEYDRNFACHDQAAFL